MSKIDNVRFEGETFSTDLRNDHLNKSVFRIRQAIHHIQQVHRNIDYNTDEYFAIELIITELDSILKNLTQLKN